MHAHVCACMRARVPMCVHVCMHGCALADHTAQPVPGSEDRYAPSSPLHRHSCIHNAVAGFTVFMIPALICSAISIGMKARLLAKNINARRADLDEDNLPSPQLPHSGLESELEQFQLHAEQRQVMEAKICNQVT